ncbi:PucR family transcriptional regulator, purine catabolism regulatory protein [Brevibacterium pityocampae]
MSEFRADTSTTVASPLTVARLLELPDLAAGAPEVLSGTDCLDAPVRWVHIVDTENTGALLEGGELVLTTGSVFRHSHDQARSFFDDLERAGVAGVVVELVGSDGAFDAEARRRVGSAAVGRTLPVVVLHRRTRFVRVTQAAHRLLIGEQIARLESARRVHEVFTGLSLEGADEQRIVDTTAELLGTAVVLEDAAHRVLAFNAAGGSVDALLAEWTASAGGEGRAAPGAETGDPQPVRLQTPVGVSGRRWGRLVVPDAGSGTEAAAHVLERAGQAVTLARMAAQNRRDLLQQARTGFVQELMDEALTDPRPALARAEALGMRSAPVYLPFVVQLEPVPGEDPTGLQLRERAALDAMSAAARTLRLPALAGGLRSGSFAVLLGLRSADDVDGRLGDLLERAGRLLDGGGAGAGEERPVPWIVGVGPAADSLSGAAPGLEESVRIVEVVATMEVRRRPFYRFADVRLRGVLSALREDARMRAFAGAELGGLIAAEGPEVIGFLRVLLESGGNKAAAARRSHLSRPALYARIARIESALGVSLEDAESRLAVHVALLWLEVGGRVDGSR